MILWVGMVVITSKAWHHLITAVITSSTIMCRHFFLIHKFIMRCSIAVRGKVPSTLQYIAESTQRNLVRNVKQNPDHSQLIQRSEKEEEENRNGGAVLSDSVITPHVKWCYLTKQTLQGCPLRIGQIVVFVGETAAIVQDVSSGFDPIVTTRACKISSREEPLPIFLSLCLDQLSNSINLYTEYVS